MKISIFNIYNGNIKTNLFHIRTTPFKARMVEEAPPRGREDVAEAKKNNNTSTKR